MQTSSFPAQKGFYIGLLVYLSTTFSVPAESGEDPDRTLFLPDPIEVSEPPIPRDKINDSLILTQTGKRYSFPGTTKILIAGDTMFNWGVEDSIQKYGYELPFEDWTPIFRSVDFSFLNLETPILRTERTPFPNKAYVFGGKEKDLEVLTGLGVTGVFLGNNHAMDYGREGLEDSLELLGSKNILHAGAGLSSYSAYKPIHVNKGKRDFYLYNASHIAERNFPFATGKKPGVAFYKESNIRYYYKKNRHKASQNTILSIHWGHEYGLEPLSWQRKSAKRMIQLGFSAVVGHHTHIPQGIEIHNGRPIIYSLGNFIFGSKNQYINHNIVVILHYNESGLVVVEVVPSYGRFQNREHIFLPLAPYASDEYLKEYAYQCKKLGTKLHIHGGRGYVFLDKTMIRRE